MNDRDVYGRGYSAVVLDRMLQQAGFVCDPKKIEEAVRELNAPEVEKVCEWIPDKYHYFWDTGCKRAFVFESSPRPYHNGFQFCPYCGAKIRAAK